jgi:hypothetical protein
MNAYNRLAIGFRFPPRAGLSEQQNQIVATNTESLDTRMLAQLRELTPANSELAKGKTATLQKRCRTPNSNDVGLKPGGTLAVV